MKRKETSQIEGIRNTLNRVCAGKDGHYVYALADPSDKTIFYIGEGVGCRVLSHTEELTAEEKIIKQQCNEAIEKANNLKNPEEREKRKKEAEQEKKRKLDAFTSKQQRIKKIWDNNQDVCHYIIKHGLTEQEGFMVESACINLLAFMGEKGVQAEKLTNIVNGHATQAEKASRSLSAKTRMRTLEEFIRECAPETVELLDVNSEVMKLDSEIVKKSIFINIKQSIDADYDGDYWHPVRGCWPLDAKKANEIEYIFAMYASQVKNVFKVEKGHVEGLLSGDTSNVPINKIRSEEMRDFLKEVDAKVKDLEPFKKEKKECVLEDNSILQKYIEYEGCETMRKRYYDEIKKACTEKTVKKTESTKPRTVINKKIKEEIKKGPSLHLSPEKREQLCIKMESDEDLFDAWKKEQFSSFLDRRYFVTEFRKELDDNNINDKRVKDCKDKVIVVNGVELTAGKGKQTPIYYGKNLLE